MRMDEILLRDMTISGNKILCCPSRNGWTPSAQGQCGQLFLLHQNVWYHSMNLKGVLVIVFQKNEQCNATLMGVKGCLRSGRNAYLQMSRPYMTVRTIGLEW